MKATAIIGANFGDEAKGKMVDYVATPTSMVVRSSGGANAGHTVVRDGVRHVFHHFGSATLQGAPTYLSEYFINNPILFFQERDILRKLGHEPRVYVDPEGLMTTPWDMMINTLVEETRGGARHGSCGVGINETMQRDQYFPFQVFHCGIAKEMCGTIMHDWVPRRLRELNLTPSEAWWDRLRSQDIFDTFVTDCAAYWDATRSASLGSALEREKSDNIVFEGAQGLLLDQDHYFFPHVTHSKTGLHNVLRIADAESIRELEVIYVTRAYLTRHGAGPFPREQTTLSYDDPTNVPNTWQGSLRFGHLDLNLLAESINYDMDDRYRGFPEVTAKLAVTCLDQVGDQVDFWQNDTLHRAPWRTMIELIAARIGVKSSLISFGPTATDIREITV